MALTGKITTFFSDKAKTKPMFPFTKTKAVSDDNGVTLDVLLDGMNDNINNVINNIDLSNYATTDELETVAEAAMPKANFNFDSSTSTLNITI